MRLTNHKVQKYLNKARKELKAEGLLVDNEFINLARVITRCYINFVADRCAKQIAKDFKKLIKKIK